MKKYIMSIFIFSFALASLFFLPPSNNVKFGVSFFPKISLILIISFLVLSVFTEKEKNEYSPLNKFFIKFIFILAMYLITIRPIGFVVTTSVYVIASMIVLMPEKHIKYWQISLIGILSSLLLRYIFGNLMNVMLPAGILF